MELSPFLLSFLLALSVSASTFSSDTPLESADGGFDSLAPEPSGEFPLSGRGVFNVNDYGAVADGKTENSLAFMAAWEEACAFKGDSIFLIPEGTFLVAGVTFSGPCFNNLSPKVLIFATLIAPTKLTTDAWIHFHSLRHLLLTGLDGSAVLNGQGAQTWSFGSACRHSMTCPIFTTSLKLTDVSHAIVKDISLVDSKGFHVAMHGCDHIHLYGFNIMAPWNSQNTDGIHISNSTNINVANSHIGVGDDCVSIGPGSFDVLVSNIRCGPGHGISVGSLGRYKNEMDVIGIRVENCTISDTQNGVRVKTWPGNYSSNAAHLTFQNIVMNNVSNPIIIDQRYCPNHSCDMKESSSVKLSEMNMRNISGTYNTKFAVNIDCSSTMPCNNVHLSYINLTATHPPEKYELGRFNCMGALNTFTVLNSTF